MSDRPTDDDLTANARAREDQEKRRARRLRSLYQTIDADPVRFSVLMRLAHSLRLALDRDLTIDELKNAAGRLRLKTTPGMIGRAVYRANNNHDRTA